MELKNLQKHICTLATLAETDSPIISCYLHLEASASELRRVLQERALLIRETLSGKARQEFEEALSSIDAFIATELLPEAKGAAIFARGGPQPFFLPLQFRVPLPNWVAVDTAPNLYHLVELKDTYHRYVVVISTEESARILEINLGAVTEELWTQRPELRQRVGRGWSKEQYQNHRRERTNQFIKETAKTLEQLMAAGGHTHLILAGDPRMTARVQQALPKHLVARLIDIVVAANNDESADVVAATLAAFVEQEEQESRAIVETLQREIRLGGLAALGLEASLKALKQGQVDVLVLAKGMEDIRSKEELVRLAEQDQCQIEVVNHSNFLMEFGGAGCLLRYLTPEQYANK